MLFILHIKDGHPFVSVVLFLSFTGEMTNTGDCSKTGHAQEVNGTCNTHEELLKNTIKNTNICINMKLKDCKLSWKVLQGLSERHFSKTLSQLLLAIKKNAGLRYSHYGFIFWTQKLHSSLTAAAPNTRAKDHYRSMRVEARV